MTLPSHNSTDSLPKVAERIQYGIERGLHTGVQLYASLNAVPIAHFALGENSPHEPLTTSHLMPWLSAGKPLTAAAVVKLIEAGALQLDQTAASIIPEFAACGKDTVTVGHLLTHTAGLQRIATGWPKAPWQEIIRRICDAPLEENWRPGARAAYDPVSAWFILGEIVRRIDGRPIDLHVREEICEPLAMSRSWMTLPRDVYDRQPLGILYSTERNAMAPAAGNSFEECSAASPGRTMRGPIGELGLFYEMLLRQGVTPDGRTMLGEESVQLMTSRHRRGMYDETFLHKVDFGLGLIVNSNQYGVETVPYGFGRHCSPETFGHGGAQSSIGFADPGRGLVVAIVANGCPGEPKHNRRFRDLVSAVYEDLQLAGSF